MADVERGCLDLQTKDFFSTDLGDGTFWWLYDSKSGDLVRLPLAGWEEPARSSGKRPAVFSDGVGETSSCDDDSVGLTEGWVVAISGNSVAYPSIGTPGAITEASDVGSRSRAEEIVVL